MKETEVILKDLLNRINAAMALCEAATIDCDEAIFEAYVQGNKDLGKLVKNYI